MKLFILLFLFLNYNFAFLQEAQDTLVGEKNLVYDTATSLNEVTVDPRVIESYKEQKSFDYIDREQKDNWWTRLKSWVHMRYHQFIEWLFGEYSANSILAFFIRALPYFIVGAILGFAVWLFIRLNPGSSLLAEEETPQVFYNEEEKLVRSQNISGLLEGAINDKNYRLAVRYYYLQLLKILNEKGIIDYDFQKTNEEYLQQIENSNIRELLKKIMRIYDFIWYGSFAVSETDFRIAQNSFQNIEATLNKQLDE